MCGIVGIVGERPAPIKAMLDDVRHRGPDHQETWEDGPVALGHARLSIIDLSHGSDQPFVDAVTGAVLVYNGEIYNYKELREDLRRRGGRFHTTGDTEVILQGYLLDGPSFFSRLNGIFAFAIWDPRSRSLILCRDPVGVKPLHVHRAKDRLAFSSEAKALYRFLPGFRLDPGALGAYFRFHYVPGSQTLVAGIERFPAGEVWTVAADGRVTVRSRLEGSSHGTGTGPVDAAALWSHLEEAVERQMVADVPVGMFLSGGIDSSIIAWLAARHAAPPFRTFSVGFDTASASQDERPLAARFAESLGASHQELLVRGDDVRRDLGAMSWHHDGPLGEGGCIPNWYVSRLAARTTKVVLAGEGGDEVFGGYPWYRHHARLERLARFVPKSDGLASAVAGVPYPAGPGANLLLRRGRWERYATIMEVVPRTRLKRAGLPAPPLGSFPEEADALQVDQATLLRDCFLPKADSMTMAHALEERVPFLDLRLLDLQRRIPFADKVGPPEKRLLREAAAPHLPADVVARKKKGYGTPMEAWAQTVLSDRLLASRQEPAAVQAGLVEARTWDVLASSAGRRGITSLRPSWLLFALDEWVRELQRRGVLA